MRAGAIELIIPLGGLLLLMVSRVPVAFALGVSGVVGIFLLQGFEVATSTLAAVPYGTAATYALTLVPMFLLMGLFVSHSGLLDEIFNVAQRLTGRLPGGLGLSAITACTIFGGISGASVADAATLGRLSIREMGKRGYEEAYAAGIVAAAGTIATLIPPSIALVVYGIVTQESVGRLLLAGIIPGLLSAVVYMVVVVNAARSDRTGRGGVQPSASGVEDTQDEVGPAFAARGLAGAGTAVALFVIVIGGLYSGVFTATEAGAVGAFAALVFSGGYVLLRRFRGSVRPGFARTFFAGSLKEAAAITSMVFALIVGAALFTDYLVIAGIPTAASRWLLGLPIPPLLVVGIFLLAMVPLGMLIDGLSMLLIVTPLAYPIVSELGFDGVWFGILLIKMIEVGLITPPVGLNVYVVSGLFDTLRVEDVFRRVLPFLAADFVIVLILFFWPDVVTFLPDLSQVGGG